MKIIISIAYFVLIASVSGESNESLLLKLSVACQNAQAEFELVPPDGSIAPGLVAGYIKTIDSSLDALVNSGYLLRERYVLKNPAEMTDKEQEDMFAVFKDMVGKLREEFGEYSAYEMVDVGVRIRILTIRKGDKFSIHVRLPKKYMEEFAKGIRPYLKKSMKKNNGVK